MHKWALAVLFSLFSLTAYASKSEIDIDWDIVEIEWQFIKKQVGAPADLPMPPIHLKELPPGARMMFQFPLTDGDEVSDTAPVQRGVILEAFIAGTEPTNSQLSGNPPPLEQMESAKISP